MIAAEWEAAELAGILTTYIAGIEDALKEPILDVVAHLTSQVDTVYTSMAPVMGEAIAAVDVNLPGE